MSEDMGVDGKIIVEKYIKNSRKAFKDHEMKKIGPGHWHLSKQDTKVFWCDIVVMGGVCLAVWGDIDGLFFSYYSGARRPEELVHWMAKFDPWYYCRQKAHIGMGGSELIDQYDDDVAIFDLRQTLKDAVESYGNEWDDPFACVGKYDGEKTIKSIYTKAIEDAIDSIQCNEAIPIVMQELHSDLMEIDQDAWEWLSSIGRIPSIRLIYALAAIERLSKLLVEKEKGEVK